MESETVGEPSAELSELGSEIKKGFSGEERGESGRFVAWSFGGD